VRSLSLPPAALTPLFTTWARLDARGALRALGDLEPQAAQTLGVAMLEVLGNDDVGIRRVLSAAPRIDADRFRIEAAILKAAQNPASALESILDLPPSKAGAAFERLAVIWIERDVHGAIAAGEGIADESLRNEFRAAVVRAWARVDPDALIDYVLDLDTERRDEALRTGALQAFALIDPQRALRAAEGVPGEIGTMMRSAGLMSLARDDPLAALSIAEALPAGPERQQMLSAIAHNYGRADPTAAIAWAQALGTPGLLGQVLSGVLRVDPERAIELVFTLPAAEQSRLMQMTVANNYLGSAQIAALADHMLAQSPRGRALQTLANSWARRAPADALPWLLAHPDNVPHDTIPQAGLNLARTDPAAAIGYLDRVPRELRDDWLSAVAEGYARNDARAAASWIAQYRGERGYEASVAAVAASTAEQDPLAAARLLDSIDLSQAPDAPRSARAIAASWARLDAAAAASWARGLSGDAAAGAVTAVAEQWAARDAPAARNWALSLVPGAERDAALVQIVGATAGTGAADPALLDAFSSAAAQQRGVSEAVRMVAARDTDAARQLADWYVTDPALREAAERMIVQGTRGPMIGPSPPQLPRR
jgi:hypothetical protein